MFPNIGTTTVASDIVIPLKPDDTYRGYTIVIFSSYKSFLSFTSEAVVFIARTSLVFSFL